MSEAKKIAVDKKITAAEMAHFIVTRLGSERHLGSSLKSLSI